MGVLRGFHELEYRVNKGIYSFGLGNHMGNEGLTLEGAILEILFEGDLKESRRSIGMALAGD